jgi:hypothetical protein
MEEPKFSTQASKRIEMMLTEISKAVNRGDLERGSTVNILGLRCLLNIHMARLSRLSRAQVRDPS